MDHEKSNGLKGDVPIVLSKWYDACKWILAKVDSFPKNQRFIFGTRLADRSLGILETLVEAAFGGGFFQQPGKCWAGLEARIIGE